MLTTAWFWIRVLDLVLGSAAVWLGLSLMQGDDRSGLKFVSVGACMIILCLAGTFWHLQRCTLLPGRTRWLKP